MLLLFFFLESSFCACVRVRVRLFLNSIHGEDQHHLYQNLDRTIRG